MKTIFYYAILIVIIFAVLVAVNYLFILADLNKLGSPAAAGCAMGVLWRRSSLFAWFDKIITKNKEV